MIPITSQRRRRIGNENRRNKDHVPLARHHKFDEASGLQFIETAIAIQSEDDRDWIHNTNATDDLGLGARNNRTVSEKRHFKGSRSLQETVNEFIVQNISRFSLDGIAFLPVRLVEKIWDVIRKRRGVSFHVFKLFSAILGREACKLDLLKHQTQIVSQRSPLGAYTKPLTSNSFDFLAILSITTYVNVVELVKLSSLTNLVALEIISSCRETNTGVSDRLVRAWSFSAQENGAFPVLRILKLENHYDVTNYSLLYIESFPALAVYDVRGCNIGAKAIKDAHLSNWKACMNKSALSLLEEACVERVKVMQSKLGLEDSVPHRIGSQPLRQNSNVKWIPRQDIPQFLAGSETTAAPIPIHDPDLSKPAGKRQRPTERQPEPWDFKLYTSVARVSELRNDRDLSSMMHVGNQALVGNDLVNSQPTASLRLGPTLSADRSMETYALAFIRIGLPKSESDLTRLEAGAPYTGKPFQDKTSLGYSAVSASTGSAPNAERKVVDRSIILSPSAHSTDHLGNSRSGSTTAKDGFKAPANSTECGASSVPRNKRRKLDDVLKSFF